jgi:hypothetical protein
MNRNFAVAAFAAVLSAAALGGCRSAFAPEPVTRVSEAPQAQIAATLRADAGLRSGPHRSAPVVDEVQAGTQITVSEAPVRGFRRVRTSDGRTGYVEEAAIELSRTASTPGDSTSRSQPR